MAATSGQRVLRWADYRRPQSPASRYRRRMQLFWATVPPGRSLRILDVGGSPETWESIPPGSSVTLANLEPPECELPPGCEFVVADARDLSRFRDSEFDVAFSNSVIEHVGRPEDQAAMARELRRVSRGYFLQVPNLFFPIEPHFLLPGFQFAPRVLRRWLASWWPFGWSRAGSPQTLRDAESIRLLSVRRLAQLLPDALVLGERFGPLNKSLLAISSPHALPIDRPGFRTLRRPSL